MRGASTFMNTAAPLSAGRGRSRTVLPKRSTGWWNRFGPDWELRDRGAFAARQLRVQRASVGPHDCIGPPGALLWEAQRKAVRQDSRLSNRIYCAGHMTHISAETAQ